VVAEDALAGIKPEKIRKPGKVLKNASTVFTISERSAEGLAALALLRGVYARFL
jgi:hypothetical protein